MSEVKSARELSHGLGSLAYIYIPECYDNIDDAEVAFNETEAEKIILSDRRAIIEKCKEWMRKQFHDDTPEYNDGINDAINILDSVLSEIEKDG